MDGDSLECIAVYLLREYFTLTLATLRCRLACCYRKVLSQPERPSDHQHAHSHSEHAQISALTPACARRV